MTEITCFKAYDARGRVPEELNEDIAYRIARAYADFVKPQRVAVGRDIRLSSADLTKAVIRGLIDSGVLVKANIVSTSFGVQNDDQEVD